MNKLKKMKTYLQNKTKSLTESINYVYSNRVLFFKLRI